MYTMTDKEAYRLAKALLDEYDIGTSSRFCDDPPDFDAVELEELANFIFEVLAGVRHE